VDGVKLFTNNMNTAFPSAVIGVIWNVIPDVPIEFFQMELLSPGGIVGDKGTFLLKFNVPKTYVDGSVALTFKSISAGSVPRVHTYAVPFKSNTITEFSKVVETKHHQTAPLDDGTYILFVNYTMRKYQQPRNATVQLVIDFDDCANATADCNNGTCVNGENTFSCACDEGYTGEFCETDVDDCVGIVCLNGALCQDSVGDYECQCLPNYFGKLCESLSDACASNVCVNGAKCVPDTRSPTGPSRPTGPSEPLGYVCDCRKGYVGPFCGIDVDECAIDPCLNGATCNNLVGNFSCSCVVGWEGKQCEINPNDCLMNEPCKNGASCKDRVGGFECACSLGWSGADCTMDVDECLSYPCENGGTCAQGRDSGSFECTCVAGFEGYYFPLPNSVLFTQLSVTYFNFLTHPHASLHKRNTIRPGLRKRRR
jgi:hypothetical protein